MEMSLGLFHFHCLKEESVSRRFLYFLTHRFFALSRQILLTCVVKYYQYFEYLVSVSIDNFCRKK